MSAPLLHPRSATLTRYADDALDAAARGRVAAHLARCSRCRHETSAIRDLVGAAAAAGARHDAPPSTDVIARALASREAGVRAVLPVMDDEAAPARPRRTARWVAIGVGAAAAAGAALVASTQRTVTPAFADAPASSASLLLGLAPSVAHAQTPPAARPNLPPIAPVDGARLRATTLRYERRTLAGAEWRPAGGGTLSLAAARVDGVDAWRSVQAWRQPDGAVESETLYVARADLRPLGRTVHVRPYLRYREITIRQRFAGDSVLGWMHTNEGVGRPIARRLPRAFAPYTTDAFAPLFLAGVALSPGWRGSISVLGWAVRREDLAVHADVRVTGEERVRVPAGTFDCWVLSLETGGRAVRYWVRKSDGVGVRVRQAGGGRTSDVVLTEAVP